MNKNEMIEILNNLITLCNDRLYGYTHAENETEAFDLKALFFHLASTSKSCKVELSKEVKALGGSVSRKTSTTGVFYRIWGHIKKTIDAKDRRVILISCEFVECLVINTYDEVLETKAPYFNNKQLSMLQSHKTLLQTDQKYLNSFNDVYSY